MHYLCTITYEEQSLDRRLIQHTRNVLTDQHPHICMCTPTLFFEYIDPPAIFFNLVLLSWSEVRMGHAPLVLDAAPSFGDISKTTNRFVPFAHDNIVAPS